MLFQQGESAGEVALIYKGEFEVIRTKRKRMLHEDKHESQKLAQLLGNPGTGKGPSLNKTRVKDNVKFKSTEIKLCLLNSGQFIGVEDVLNDRNYTTTVRCCTNNAIIYTLNTENFFFWIGKNDRTLRLLQEMIFTKDTMTKAKIAQDSKLKRQEQLNQQITK